jgi:Na+-driven multidrug efflux pump
VGICISDPYSEDNIILAQYATEGLRIYFIGFVFVGINIIIAAFLSAIQKPRKAFLVSITRGVLAIIPLALALSFLFGMTGVWLSFLCAEVITSVIAVYFIKSEKRSLKESLFSHNLITLKLHDQKPGD